ncbi:MAG: hypothetical protein K8F91_22310, partial [Candidatus Obscuribacterales bacterium]|nr:hypothetical protein [Candidatus Obscuribacterales bacterium]
IFDRYFPLPSLMNLGYLPILTQSRIEYKKSIGLFDKPQGHMWIDSIKEARFEFEGEILVDARLTTRVWHTGVFLSKETMKPVRIPQLIKQRFVELYGKPIKPVH